MTSKPARFVTLLYEKTLNGELNWEPTETEDVYQCAFPNYSVRISERGADYVVTIYNEQGTVIEEMTDVTLKDEIDNSFEKMRQIYDTARRVAMGVDKALDDLLSYLDNNPSDSA